MLDRKAKKLFRKVIQPRYKTASRKEKQAILNEFCRICGYHRKYAIWLLQQPVRRKLRAKRKPGRKPLYKAIPLWLPYYDKHYETINETTRKKLLTLSASTIDRLLKSTRQKLEFKKKLCGTRPGKLFMLQC